MMPSEVKSGNHDIIAVNHMQLFILTLRCLLSQLIIFTIKIPISKLLHCRHLTLFIYLFHLLSRNIILFISLCKECLANILFPENTFNHIRSRRAPHFNDASICYIRWSIPLFIYLMDGMNMNEPAIVQVLLLLFKSWHVLPSNQDSYVFIIIGVLNQPNKRNIITQPFFFLVLK